MPRKRKTKNSDTPAPPAPDQGAVFTVPEVARRWRVHRHTVMRAIREGRLQAFKVGNLTHRIREAEVLRYEQQHMGAAA